MNKREMAKKLRGWGRIEINHQQLTNEVAEAAAAALEREANAEEQPSGKCSVSIANGLVHGEFEQVKAVQELIVENEKLRREARGREEQKRNRYSLKEQEKACRFFASNASSTESFNYSTAARHAADTLRRLDEEGGRLLCERHKSFLSVATDFLLSLGVEPKP